MGHRGGSPRSTCDEMRLGLAVSSATRDGVADSPVLLASAAALGVTARMIDWRSDGWDWADVVLLHAPWDYTSHVGAFTGWLQSLSERKPVFNNYASVATNMHKSYLLDLAAAGIPVPLTRLLRAGCVIDVDELRSTFGSSPVVAKPAVGAGGRRLARPAAVEDITSCPLVSASGVPTEDVIVQAFVSSIEADGEYSLVVIAGKPSHLVHKTPAAGQFRVQTSHGGTERRVEMDSAAEGVAELLRSHVEELGYARIDYVLGEVREPLLMELEMTEPDLFLRHYPKAAEALVQHVWNSS